MRKGFKSFCNGDGSTSTLNQQQQADNSTTTTTVPEESLMDSSPPPHHHNNNYLVDNYKEDKISLQPTLEEMILQLELEEKMAAKSRAKLDEYADDTLQHHHHHRMSCVNSSDILRSARNALNQYPRFSLDGKDAMYRSSFCPVGGRKSIMWCNHRGLRKGFCQVESRGQVLLPAKIGGESVVWCKAGVVAKLMGLEAMPVPIPAVKNTSGKDERLISSRSSTSPHHVIKEQNQLIRKRSRERRGRGGVNVVDSITSSNGCSTTGSGILFKRSSLGGGGGSCSKTGYCIMNPAVPMEVTDELAGRPMRYFL